MARPTLVIGVGGTGQWVLAHVKKNLLDTYGMVPEEVKLHSLDTTQAPSATAGGGGASRTTRTEAAWLTSPASMFCRGRCLWVCHGH
ncbi:MAG: hypothetical protein HC884_08815 [Chloroflexaceae bacterium]|nr:hypothetical protein [Chloroflexaceae bacterium]